MELKELQSRMLALRSYFKLNYTQISHITGLGVNTWRNIEKGKCVPSRSKQNLIYISTTVSGFGILLQNASRINIDRIGMDKYQSIKLDYNILLRQISLTNRLRSDSVDVGFFLNH